MQGDFVHADPKVESAFRIFETLPIFIGNLKEYHTPNQRNAAILHYIGLQKKFLRRGWEPDVGPSPLDNFIDNFIRLVVLGSIKGTGVVDQQGDENEDENRNGGDPLPAPLFPIQGGDGRGAGIGNEAGARTAAAAQVATSIDHENERRVRTFFSRTMDYCDALYRACGVSASILYAFRDSRFRLKAYIGQQPGLQTPEVITAELTAKTFSPAHAILVDHEDKAVVVVIRGTLSVSDLLTDLISDAVNSDGERDKTQESSTGGREEEDEDVVEVEDARGRDPDAAGAMMGGVGYVVHEGMYESAKALGKALAKPVLQLLKDHSYRKVVLTGHSLGGGTTALLYSLWASDAKFKNVDLFAAAHACPAVASLKFTEKHFYDRYERTDGSRPPTPADHDGGSRFFAATVIGWDLVPRASQTAVHNLQRCVSMLCVWHESGMLPSGDSSSSAQEDSAVRAEVVSPPEARPVWKKVHKPQAAPRELWDKAQNEPVKLDEDDKGVPQLLVPGEKVFFVPLEMEGRAVWQRPTFFDEIVLTANMIDINAHARRVCTRAAKGFR
eukprot:g7904.t1